MDPAAHSLPNHGEIPINNGGRRYSRRREEEEEEERENGESTIEVKTKKPRGRPPGAKNKPKPSVIIDRNIPNSLQSIVMEVATGADIAESIAEYARRRRRGIFVLSANGSVSNVTLTQAAAHGALALYGRFEILSLSGTFLPEPGPQVSNGLTVYLAGAQGRVVGGTVVGSLAAAGTVMIIAATFSSAVYQRLPVEEDEPEKDSGRDDGGVDQVRLIAPSTVALYASDLPSESNGYDWAQARSSY